MSLKSLEEVVVELRTAKAELLNTLEKERQISADLHSAFDELQEAYSKRHAEVAIRCMNAEKRVAELEAQLGVAGAQC